MTGRYLILTPRDSYPSLAKPKRNRYRHSSAPIEYPNETRFKRGWTRYVTLCESLHRDGLDYTVEFNLTAETPHILVLACGTAKPRRPIAETSGVAARLGFRGSQPVANSDARDRALECAYFLPEFLEKRNPKTDYWTRRKPRYTELSTMSADELRAEYEYWRELEFLSSGKPDSDRPAELKEAVA